MVYIYPIDFESKPVFRKSLIVFSIAAIILFQLFMFIVSGSVLSKRINIYLFAFLVIQSMVVFTVFEFIRKPWEGKELEVERAIQQQANNLFESISSYHTDKDGFYDGGGFYKEGDVLSNTEGRSQGYYDKT